MDLRDLRAFVAISETGSLAAASKVLHIGSPALSERLKGLEEELKTQLFERGARGLLLSERGEEFLSHAYAVLKRAEDAKASMLSRDLPPVGSVRFGVPGSLVGILTVPLIEHCLERYPEIRLRVVESMSGYLANWLREGTVDAAIVFGGSAASDRGIAFQSIAEEELYLATYDADLVSAYLTGENEIRLRDIQGVPLVMPGPEHGLRILCDATARRSSATLNVLIEIDASPQIFSLIKSRRLATICSLAALHPSTIPGSALERPLFTYRLREPYFQRPIYLATPLNRPSSRATLAVSRAAVETLQRLTGTDGWTARAI
jgi:LysR family transcriptional regulator, nitrogen assimilation regulatory protein